jgi:hypothetical protein
VHTKARCRHWLRHEHAQWWIDRPAHTSKPQRGKAAADLSKVQKATCLHSEVKAVLPAADEVPRSVMPEMPIQIVQKAARSLLRASAIDATGFRPNRKQGAPVGEQADKVLIHFTAMVELLAAGRAPAEFARHLAGADLQPLPKSDGGVRLVAAGKTPHRLTSKCVCVCLCARRGTKQIVAGAARRGGRTRSRDRCACGLAVAWSGFITSTCTTSESCFPQCCQRAVLTDDDGKILRSLAVLVGEGGR